MSFEGDPETLAQFIPYIEETWSLDEKGPNAYCILEEVAFIVTYFQLLIDEI